MKQQYTKGPWSAKGTKALAGNFVIECSSKVDAQLIATAPELLEVVNLYQKLSDLRAEREAEKINGQRQRELDGLIDQVIDEAMFKRIAAIAKATGNTGKEGE